MLRSVNRQGVFEEPEDYREVWNQTCPYDSWTKKERETLMEEKVKLSESLSSQIGF